VEALVFAAGLGSRLAPLTDRVPKALLEVGGVPMLERVATRLVEAGVDRIVVNVCPHPDAIERFVRERRGFGVEVLLSREEDGPYETGGGLLAARPLLRADGPILLHNVDVLTDLPLRSLLASHVAASPLATLAVMDRPTSRRLLFDDEGLLGRVQGDVRREVRPPRGEVRSLAFAGVHVVEPRLLGRIVERGTFPIWDPLLRLAGEGERVLPFRADGCRWIDVGRPADLERARAAAR
jgi:NDP-sugar pyrophosphorylase family protein